MKNKNIDPQRIREVFVRDGHGIIRTVSKRLLVSLHRRAESVRLIVRTVSESRSGRSVRVEIVPAKVR